MSGSPGDASAKGRWRPTSRLVTAQWNGCAGRRHVVAARPARLAAVTMASRPPAPRRRRGRAQPGPRPGPQHRRHAPLLSGVNGMVRTPAGDTWLTGPGGVLRVASAHLERSFADLNEPLAMQVFGPDDGSAAARIPTAGDAVVQGGDGGLPGLPPRAGPCGWIRTTSASGRLECGGRCACRRQDLSRSEQPHTAAWGHRTSRSISPCWASNPRVARPLPDRRA